MKVSISFFSTCFAALVALHAVAAAPSKLKNTSSKDSTSTSTAYQIGLGIADVTGPPVEVNMMGYAAINQIDTGIHQRQRSRAFIVVDPTTNERIVYVSADICMGSDIVRTQVLQRLNTLYNGLYNEQNVAIAGTHTHAGPAGFLQYTLYQITSLGYIPQTTQAIVDGIVRSIQRAHNNIAPGDIFVGSADVEDGNINRSPYAYDNNPADEKARYQYNTDHTMTLLKFVDANGKPLGLFNWYAVHCTSMYENNTLVSGDNKGYASYLFEQMQNPTGTLPGQGSFVAAFAQANVGDTSPNTLGAVCEDTGLPCDYATSTCGNPPRSQECKGRGPGWPSDFLGFESTRIIGTRQVNAALEIFNGNATEKLSGPVGSIHQYVDMPNYNFTLNGTNIQLCKPALGYGFAAGTTDGPGQFDFKQADNSSGNIFWNIVRGVVAEPSSEQVECQKPKPIILDVGESSVPYAWAATNIDTQILRIGKLVLIIFPGEATTMSGRRLRETVKQTLVDQGLLGNDSIVLLSGPANTYTHYIATFEEYQVQRYEGASTIFGPHSLQAYQQIFSDLAIALFKNQTVPAGQSPPDLTGQAIQLITPPPMDIRPLSQDFGTVVADVGSTYGPGDTVSASFIAGNPRNDLMSEKTYLTIESQQSDKSWVVVRTDGDWGTRFSWVKEALGLAGSQATIEWTIEQGTPAGTYRIGYFGSHKLINGSIVPHSGYSSTFKVSGGTSSGNKRSSL